MGSVQPNRGNWFLDLVRRGPDREYLAQFSVYPRLDQVRIPTLHIASWYDIFQQGTLDNFRYLRRQGKTEAARQAKLIIGPWTHLDSFSRQGEINFGTQVSASLIAKQTDLISYQLRWFDRFLKGFSPPSSSTDRLQPVLRQPTSHRAPCLPHPRPLSPLPLFHNIYQE